MLASWVRHILRSNSFLYSVYKYVFDNRHYHLGTTRDTAVVIEGFPRSGNSFAVVAFEMAQEATLRIAHHWHSPSQFAAAIRWDIPAILVIRNPSDAVISYAIYRSSDDLSGMLREYIWFHESVIRYLEGILVVDFGEITMDFGTVIDRINRRFGTDFDRFDHNEDTAAEVFRRIETYQQGERQFSRPSLARRENQARLRRRLEDESMKALLSQAEAVYRRILALSGHQGAELAHE